MEDKKSESIRIRIRPEEHRQLKILAAQRGVSLGVIIECAIDLLQNHQQKPPKIDAEVFEALKRHPNRSA